MYQEITKGFNEPYHGNIRHVFDRAYNIFFEHSLPSATWCMNCL